MGEPSSRTSAFVRDVAFGAYSTDGLNLVNCAWVENVVCRLVQIERAVARNPKAPDFTGLDVITAVGIDDRGTAHADSFSDFITEKQKNEAFALKQTRLYAEEQGKLRGKGSGENDCDDGDGAKAKRPRGKEGKGQDAPG